MGWSRQGWLIWFAKGHAPQQSTSGALLLLLAAHLWHKQHVVLVLRCTHMPSNLQSWLCLLLDGCLRCWPGGVLWWLRVIMASGVV
jgi:hypothetical protein